MTQHVMRGIALVIFLVMFLIKMMAVSVLWIVSILAHPLHGAMFLTLLILFLWR